MSLVQGQTLSRDNLNAAFLSKAEDNYIFADIITTGTIGASVINCTESFITNGSINGLMISEDKIEAPNSLTITSGGSNQDILLKPSGTGKIILNANVGIGTADPSEKLHVIGNLRLTGSLTDGTNSLTVANVNAAYTHSQSTHLSLGTTSTTAFRGDYGQAAYNHIHSDGSDHTFINQDVTFAAKPTFAGIISTGRIEINTKNGDYANSAPRAISWYDSACNTWATYMAPSGSAAGYNGTARTTLGGVTSWALISKVENGEGYGWIWESGPNDNTPATARMSLSANTGDLYVTGNMTSNGVITSPNMSVSNINGSGYRFWNSNSYKIYMSASNDATYGGNLDGTSDYNMYFKMTGGTNRGFVFKNGDTNVAQIDGSGNLYAAGTLTLSGGTSRIYMGPNGVSEFGLVYSPSYTNHGIYYKEGSPDKIVLSPDGTGINSSTFVVYGTNTGIGTSTPSTRLQIGDPSLSSSDEIVTITSKASAGIKIIADTDNDNQTETHNPYVYFSQDNEIVTAVVGLTTTGLDPLGTAYTGVLDNSFLIGAHHASYPIQFGTNKAVRMTILNNGRVGIGTTAPTEALHVVGNLKVEGNVSGNISGISYGKYSMQYNSTEDSLDFIYTP